MLQSQKKILDTKLMRLVLAIGGALVLNSALGHSVGQVQTTKFFAPETVQLLVDRVAANQPAGFQVGDVLTYIIQFTPIANNATTGVAGYITDYIPPGVEVVGADIVNRDASGNYYPVSPKFPAGIDSGWGNQGQRTYAAPFNVLANYDITGRCNTAGFVANCNGRLTEVYADTGVFYSTDPRTAVFPQLPTRILQGLNGYNVNPTAAGQLNPIIGQAVATTHNLWDADQTNAFGSSPISGTNPRSLATQITNSGRGAAPYFAGSAVAGPQTGYQQDNTAQVGPWKRIAYQGSRIGDPTSGPAALPEVSNTAVGGLPTSLGYNVSPSNPLPSGTNAVRWAVGKLVVGQLSFVRIKLRITQPVANEGITNSSEVFGGDAGDADSGQDSTWRYHVPSVADNNSNLYVSKIPCQYDASATSCTPLSGSYYPANSTITYQITYLNTGNAPQSNVVLQDYLPCQTAAARTVRVGLVSGPLSTLAPLNSLPYTTTTASAGNCATTPQTRYTVTFPTITSLGPAAGGRMIINIPNSAGTAGDDVINIASLSSAALPAGVRSAAVTFVGNATNPALAIVKTVTPSMATSPGTVTYTIVVTNSGTGPATVVQFDDILPSNGDAAVNVATRFNFGAVSQVASSGLTTATALVTSTTTAALGTLAPYNTQAGAANRVKVNFNFGTGSSLATNGVITLTFTVNVGSAVVAASAPYYNNAVAQGTTGSLYRVDSGDTAPVTIAGNLAIAKILECYYSGATCVAANAANDIPPNAQVRYRVTYSNLSASAIGTVTISDILPCQVTAAAGSPTVTLTAVVGPITGAFVNRAVSNGNCTGTRQTVVLGSITSLAAAGTGSFTLETPLRTPSTTSTVVVNDAVISGSAAGTTTAQVQANVTSSPNLQITKIATPTAVPPGGTLTYTISVVNVGTTAAQVITIYDILPTGTSTVADSTRRFDYILGTSVFTGALSSVVPTTQTNPTISPYNSGPYAANQIQTSWVFSGQTLAVGATATLQFQARAGTNLVALPPPNYYNNNAVVTYFNGQQAASNAASANVSLVASLEIAKTNGVGTVTAGGTTNYTVTVSNLGPSAANGSVVKDAVGADLSCPTVTCATLTGGAACPAALPLGTPVNVGSTNFFSTGEAIPTFPASSTVVFRVSCMVTATGL